MKVDPDVKMEVPDLTKAEVQRIVNAPENELEPAKLRKRPRASALNNDDRTDSRMRLVDELISSIGVKPEPESAPGPSPVQDVHAMEASPDPLANAAKPEEHVSPASDRARKRARLAPVDPTQSSVASAGMAPRPRAPERTSVVHTSRASAFNENTADQKPVLLAQNRSLKASGSTQPASMAKRQAVPDMVKEKSLNTELFKDMTFSHDVQAGYQAMEEAIVGSGGKLIPLDDVRNGTPVDYLISRMCVWRRDSISEAHFWFDRECVPVLMPRLKSTTTRVTENWIEMCLTEDRFINPDNHVAYKPLPAPLPVPGKSTHHLFHACY